MLLLIKMGFLSKRVGEMSKKGNFFFKLLIALLLIGCDDKSYFTARDAKRQTLHFFPELQDTTQIGVVEVSQDKENHWFVAYNNTHVAHPRVYLFHKEEPTEVAHTIDLRHKYDANVEKVYFEDVTNDGEYELMLEVHFDYKLAYQARELLIFQHPFDSANCREIFSFLFEETREKIEGFDTMYSLPIHTVQVEHHTDFITYEGYIVFEGIMNGHRNRIKRFKWDPNLQQFRLELDEDLHEADDEESAGGITHKTKGTKILKQINAHEADCKAYLLEDVAQHVIDIGQDVHDALLCSNLTSLSPAGRFLVYTDRAKHQITLLDFKTNHRYPLVENIHVYEGFSDVAWSPGGNRLAFVVINPEEFVEHTAILIAEVDKAGKLHKHVHHKRVYYECPTTEECLPIKDYDYKFDAKGHLRYRTGAKTYAGLKEG